MERWTPVVGFEELAEVSDLGNVRYSESQKPIRQRVKGWGYSEVAFRWNGQRSFRVVHVLVLEAFAGIRPPGMQGNHINGNKQDNRLVNLEWVTAKENRQHAGRTGLWNNRGERHCLSKLNEQSVREIRSAIGSNGDIAKRYGVSEMTVSNVRRRRAWAHVI